MGIIGPFLRTASHTRLRARDHYTSSTLIGGIGGAGPSLRFTLRLRDQRRMWLQDGCKVYMDSYMATNESCFMVTWTIFRNHLLVVGLTQNQETMALQMLTTVDLFYFIMCEDEHEHKSIEIWLRVKSHLTSHDTWGSVTTLHEFGSVFGTNFGHFLLGSHNVMVTALASCVKWPLEIPTPTGSMLTSFGLLLLLLNVRIFF
jgi:hypothetical protein